MKHNITIIALMLAGSLMQSDLVQLNQMLQSRSVLTLFQQICIFRLM